MKLQDKETLSVADAVKNVLENKKAVNEMDPKDHVTKDGDSYVVKKNDGTVMKSFDSEEEASAWATKNHDAIMKESEEPNKPSKKNGPATGEDDFDKKHKIKKTGANDKGEVSAEGTLPPALQKAIDKKNGKKTDDEDEVEEGIEKEGNKFTGALNAARKNGDKTFVVSGKKYTVSEYDDKEDEDEDELDEAKKAGKGKVTIDVDYSGDTTDAKNAEKKFKLKIKMRGRGTADVTGDKANIVKWLKSDMYGMDQDDIEDIFANLFEDTVNEDQKAYQAFFAKALKKFGVTNPAELKGDKKKEFFDYVDANYNSKAEKGTDGVKEGISDVIGKVKDKVKGVDRDKIKKINLKINALVDKDREAQAKLKAAEQNDSLSDEEFDKKESFYNEVMANIGKEISQLKDSLKKARAGRRG